MEQLEQTAECLYAAYCAAVGGKAYDGKPLPNWAAFRADPAKQKQVEGWLAAAQKAIELLSDAN